MAGDVLDDFQDLSGWMPVTSGLAELVISSAPGPGGVAMQLDFDFKGGGGFVVARKPFSHPMPESYTISFSIRGAAPANRFELKLADPSGKNVWWRHWDAYELPADWREVSVRSNEVEFAYGPAGGGAMSRLGAIELALAAGPGGAGTLSIADLRIEDRTYRQTPLVKASSGKPGYAAQAVLDGDPATSWRSEPSGSHWLEVDFRQEREYGGLIINWLAGATPRRFRVDVSHDGATWKKVHTAEPAGAERSYVYLPNAESRFVRLTLDAANGAGCGIAELAVQPFEFSRSIHSFFEHVARTEPRGHHPRWLAPEATYWTPIGLADGNTSAIMNEEGMVEVDRGTFSIEPFVHAGGRLLTWADVELEQTLEDGWIPIPSSVWRSGDLTLRTTAFAGRQGDLPVLYLRYRLENASPSFLRAQLFAAIRPYQVNPPWQAFGELGGMRRISELAWDGTSVEVDAKRIVVPLTPPSGFGAAAFEHGTIASHLTRGELPALGEVTDSFGYASGALAFDLNVAAGGSSDVYLAVPFGAYPPSVAGHLVGMSGAAAFEAALRDWHERLGSIAFDLPPSAADHGDAVRTAAAQVLINRDGAALQPGPRRYTRSWIRDGAIMAGALLRCGQSGEAAEFSRWYAQYQAADGNVPCCVDANGADWLAEHDSHGELIFAVMDYYRFTRDRDFLVEMWPAVRKAVDFLEALRATRLGPEFDAPELVARRGLIPESVSHEGYLSQPVHSYWDDFWALQGYRDASVMASILGNVADAERIAVAGEEFHLALRASIERTIADRNIQYLPGSVEWADFDPTATANSVALLDAVDDLPPAALERTFDTYMEGLRRRRSGEMDWNNYSAYEIRIVGALVHLGRRDDANELMDFLLGDRRPRPWNQWPEITWRNPRSPGHLGDVPHTWIGAEYVLALRSMLIYERPSDESLVLAAGVPASWLDEGEVGATGLPTHYGVLDFSLRRDNANTTIVSLSGDLEIPRGGIVLRPPLAGALAGVEVNGRPVATFDTESATIDTCPAHVILRT